MSIWSKSLLVYFSFNLVGCAEARPWKKQVIFAVRDKTCELFGLGNLLMVNAPFCSGVSCRQCHLAQCCFLCCSLPPVKLCVFGGHIGFGHSAPAGFWLPFTLIPLPVPLGG